MDESSKLMKAELGHFVVTPPAISVVIPVYNDVEMLAQCLGALSASSYSNYECIVVDDGSAQDVGEVAERFSARYLRVEDGPRGPAHARNKGAASAGGDILLFIDADVLVHRDTLGKVAEVLECRQDADAVFGSYDDSPAAAGFFSQYKNLFHHFVHQNAREDAATSWSGCGAIRRDVFLSLRGFDERRYRRPCIEDIELGYRLQEAGRRVLLIKEIQVKHLKRWTLGSMARSDILDRGIPWTILILGRGRMHDDLNLKRSQRVSAMLSFLLLLSAALLPIAHAMVPPRLLVVPPLFALGMIVLVNRRLYSFFARKRGWWFALVALPFHLLYYLYSLFSLAAGTGLYLPRRRKAG